LDLRPRFNVARHDRLILGVIGILLIVDVASLSVLALQLAPFGFGDLERTRPDRPPIE
jgi:hypothetical protein